MIEIKLDGKKALVKGSDDLEFSYTYLGSAYNSKKAYDIFKEYTSYRFGGSTGKLALKGLYEAYKTCSCEKAKAYDECEEMACSVEAMASERGITGKNTDTFSYVFKFWVDGKAYIAKITRYSNYLISMN